jgi:uncharacterized Zn-binding protein involved in type VI secretion
MGSHFVATVGSPLDHGGAIIEGSPKHTAGGKPIARVGDRATCARHGPVTIVDGSPGLTVDGKPCARVTSRLSCGARIIDGSPKFTCN